MVGFYRKLTKDKQFLEINSFSKINGSSLPPFTYFFRKSEAFQFCQVCPKSTMRVWICVKYSNMTLLCFKFASNSIRIGNQSSCVSFLFAPNKLVPIDVTNFQLCFWIFFPLWGCGWFVIHLLLKHFVTTKLFVNLLHHFLTEGFYLVDLLQHFVTSDILLLWR